MINGRGLDDDGGDDDDDDECVIKVKKASVEVGGESCLVIYAVRNREKRERERERREKP